LQNALETDLAEAVASADLLCTATKTTYPTSNPIQEVTPRLLNVIFRKHPDYVARPQRGEYFLGLHRHLSRASYVLGVRDGKDVVTYRPKPGDELNAIRRGAISFAGDLGLRLLPDQTRANVSLQSGINALGDPATLRLCKEVVFHVQERDAHGPVAEVRRIAGTLRSHWLESVGFNCRLLAGSGRTIFDSVAIALSPFGVVREDLPHLIWLTQSDGIKNIRRRFFLNNPDLLREIVQAEYPARLQMMPLRWLDELRLRIAKRMTRANFVAWRIDGYRNVAEFRGLSLQEVGGRCFDFRTVGETPDRSPRL
jgi:hypothetical protein